MEFHHTSKISKCYALIKLPLTAIKDIDHLNLLSIVHSLVIPYIPYIIVARVYAYIFGQETNRPATTVPQ